MTEYPADHHSPAVRDEASWDHQSTDLLQGTIFTLVGAVTVILNLIMATVYRLRGFRKPTNRVMFGITMSDVGGGLVGLYVGIYFLAAKRSWFQYGILDEILCYMWPMIWLACTFATTLLVPLISIIRFIAVIYPLKFQLLKTRHVMPAIASCWALSLLAALYPIYPGGGYFKIPQQAMCIFDLTKVSILISQIYGWFFNFLPTIISVITIIITNTFIVYKLIKKSRLHRVTPAIIVTLPADVSPDDSQQKRTRFTISMTPIGQTLKMNNLPAKKKIVSGQSKTILSLALLYLICYAQKVFIYSLVVSWPNKTFQELVPLHMSNEAAEVFIRVSDYCVTVNSCLNPLVYFAFSSKIRREFIHVVSFGVSGVAHLTTGASRVLSNIHPATASNNVVQSEN